MEKLAQLHDQPADDWWGVVEEMARFVNEHPGQAYDSAAMRNSLKRLGYPDGSIEAAVHWLREAETSCEVHEIFDMFEPATAASRVTAPLEDVSVGDHLVVALMACVRAGLISPVTAERLVEALRSLDMRDWEGEDLTDVVRSLVEEAYPPETVERLIARILGQEPMTDA